VRAAGLAALLAGAAVAGSARGVVPGIPAIYVEYNDNC